MREVRGLFVPIILNVALPVTEFCPVSWVSTTRKSFFPNLGGAIDIVNFNGTLE
jgi:hypothetical protein